MLLKRKSSAEKRSKPMNKRVAPRMPTMLRVEYSTKAGDVLSGYSTNISETGLFLHTAHSLEKGNRIHLRLKLPGAPKPIHVMGEVMWFHGGGSKNPTLPGVGVRFQYLSEEHKTILGEFLQNFR